MRVVVLGAGVIGVTSAWYLMKAGHEVVVVDRQEGPALAHARDKIVGGLRSRRSMPSWQVSPMGSDYRSPRSSPGTAGATSGP